jgi:hypothetical protein
MERACAPARRRREDVGSDSNALIQRRIVYVVDDDDSVRDSLRALLESYEMTVWDYASANAFLTEAEQARGCLLLDLHMPGLAGLALLKRLQSQGSHLSGHCHDWTWRSVLERASHLGWRVRLSRKTNGSRRPVVDHRECLSRATIGWSGRYPPSHRHCTEKA